MGALDIGVRIPSQDPWLIQAEDGGYLQAIDEAGLADAVAEGAFTVRVERRIGDYVLPRSAIASIWPPHAVTDEVARRIQGTFVFGFERTHVKDIDYAIRQMADIAVKALSPGINDPTTATICIDRLAEVLTKIGFRRRPANFRQIERGSTLIILPMHPYSDLVDLAFTQIRHYGSQDPVVAEHLVSTLGKVAMLVPAWHRPALGRQAELVVAQLKLHPISAADIARIEQAARWTA
jgi:uncharacterized membrane protein